VTTQSAAFALRNKRTIRARVNPLDVCTVVSILPKAFRVYNATITPSLYEMPPGSYEKPEILHVGPASWWKETGENEPLLEIPDSSMIVADALVRDFIGGILGCDMAESLPGLFFIPGKLTVAELKIKHKDLLDLAKTRQDNWFNFLIDMGDVLWSSSNGNPRSISGDMRLAADMMGVKETKPWMQNYVAAKLVPCVACGNLRNPEYPICPSCNTIVDATKYKTLGLAPVAKA